MRILFLANILPYPVNNGGRVIADGLIDSLIENGHAVDVLGFVEGDATDVKVAESGIRKKGCHCKGISHKITTSTNMRSMLPIAFKSIFSPLPFSVVKCESCAMRDYLDHVMMSHDYDLLIVEHLQMAYYLDQARATLPNVPVLLDEQNCESEIAQQRYNSEKNPALKLFFGMELTKLRRFERSAIEAVDKTRVLSHSDEEKLLEVVGHQFDHSIIPITMHDAGYVPRAEHDGSLNLLFIGTLSWEPNYRGLLWFVENVLPHLDEVCLTIAGSGLTDDLAERLRNEKTTLLGYVDSTDEVFATNDAMIVPLFMGSGQRVKIIESFMRGLPVISTDVGAKGLVYESGFNLINAETDVEFIAAVEEMRECSVRRCIAENARRTYERYYSDSALSKEVERLIGDCG